MLYPQNGDRIVAIDFVTSLHPMYMKSKHTELCGVLKRELKLAVRGGHFDSRQWGAVSAGGVLNGHRRGGSAAQLAVFIAPIRC